MRERILAKEPLIRVLVFAALLVTNSSVVGQNESQLTANVGVGVGGGYTPLVGGISKRLNNGWHIKGGVGYKFTSYFSISFQASYTGLGVSRAVLNEAQVPNGNAHVWSFTADPKLGFKPYHGVGTYLIGAVGYYRRVVQFTRPTLLPVIIFDPFFGVFQGFVPADKVLGTIARGGIGGGAGAGLEFGIGSRAGNTKLFTEARYEYAATGAMPTRMVPVTFGIRW